MKLKDILNIIETEYPKILAYDWDNPGLFYGNIESEIKNVIVTLDVTPKVIEQAVNQKAELILSHHPFTMDGLKTLSDNSMHSNMVREIIKNEISVYSAHTNMDTAKNGINQKLAELFLLKNIEILDPNPNFQGCGLGRVGELEDKISLFDFCEIVKDKLNTPFVRVCGNDRVIKKVCVASGSCSEFIPLAISKCADVIITGDMKYHPSIEFVYDGISIIDAGHYPTEIIARDMFREVLKNTGLHIIDAEIFDIFKTK